MIDWIVSLLSTSEVASAAEAVAAVPDMTAPASVMGVILVNVFTALPPTIAAITAMVIAIRSNRKQDVAADKQETAVATAAEAARRAEVAIQKADHVIEDRVSTAKEDAMRTSMAVGQVLKELKSTHDSLCESLKLNRALMEQILVELQTRPTSEK